jgi:chromosome segregation ATPase
MSKTASDLRTEKENLEIEKDALQEAIKKKSKEIEGLQKVYTELHGKLNKEAQDMEKKKVEFKEIESAAYRLKQDTESKKNILSGEYTKLDEERKSLRESAGEIVLREKSLEARIKLLQDREKYVSEIFAGLEKLKGK